MNNHHHPHPPASWDDLCDCEPRTQIAGIVAYWCAHDLYGPTSTDRLAELTARYATRLESVGVASVTDADHQVCQGYITAPTRRGHRRPSNATMHLRRVALRAIYRTIAQLGGPDHDPTTTVVLPPKTPTGTRPCTPEELGLVRTAAVLHQARHLHPAAVVAVCEATATTGEAARLGWDDIDLNAGVVHLPGAGPTQARTGILTDWAHQILTTHHPTHRAPRRWVVAATAGYRPTQAAVVMLLRRLLNEAHLDDPDLKPHSIRLAEPARRLSAGARIEHAATEIGLTSLDTTARLLDWHWEPQ